MESITMNIDLASEHSTYSPGVELKGYVNLNIAQQVIISRISVMLLGEGVLKDKTELHVANEKKELYIQEEKCIYSSKDRNLEDLYTEAGNHILPFTFLLPERIPTSFESEEGYVRYVISSSLEVSKLPLLSTKIYISVNAPLDLNSIPKSQYPSTAVIDKKNNDWWWCCAKTKLHVGIHTPRRGYVPGEVITLNAEIRNFSSKPIVSVKAQLMQIIKYHHKTWPRKLKRIASEITRGYILPTESQYWMDEPLFIPAVISSYMKHCSLIDIKYRIYFRIAKAGMPEIVLKLPIIIGNVPLMGCVDVLSDTVDPDQRSVCTLQKAKQSHEPCHFGPYDVTESDDNSQDRAIFSPRYITYSS